MFFSVIFKLDDIIQISLNARIRLSVML